MKNIQEIKKEKQEKTDKLITDCLVFFAFSNEQFVKNKTKLEEGEKYVSIGAGGYMPKSKVDSFTNGLAEINKTYKAEIKANKGARRANIVYELANHEAYYTGDITDTIVALGSGYTRKEVLKIYNEEKIVENARN